MAGYSGTPLVVKLGIKPAHRVVAIGAPAGFTDTLGDLPDGATLATRWPTKRGVLDVVLLFVRRQRDYEKQLPKAQDAIHDAGSIWVAWPKKSSGVESDLTENTIRNFALLGTLVDNKVCAIDDTWSGLRLVVRVAARVSKKSMGK